MGTTKRTTKAKDTWSNKKNWLCRKWGKGSCQLKEKEGEGKKGKEGKKGGEGKKGKGEDACDDTKTTHRRQCVIRAMVKDLQNQLNISKQSPNAMPSLGYTWMKNHFADAYKKYDASTKNQHHQHILRWMIKDLKGMAKQPKDLDDWNEQSTVAACLEKPYNAYAFHMFGVNNVTNSIYFGTKH